MAGLVKPDSLSTLGFANASASKLMMIATGIGSVSVYFLPTKYYQMLTLNLTDITNQGQVWRLLSSQFMGEYLLTDTVSTLFLIYHFRILERRWGTSKFMSHLLSSWSLSLSLYYAIYKSRLLEHTGLDLQNVPSGLYGPLFATFVHFLLDIPPSSDARATNTNRLSLPTGNTWLVCLIMLKMLISLDSPKVPLLSLCGIVAGILQRSNFLGVQSWFKIPKWLSRTSSKVFGFLGFVDNLEEFSSRSVLMGATPEIHEDMLYDYAMQRERMMPRRFGPSNVNNREQIGQGYAEVMNPSSPFNFIRHPQPPPPPRAPSPPTPPENPQPPQAEISSPQTDNVPEEKVQTLVDMGFDRDAVLNALASTGNDVNQATAILLSAS